MPPEHMIPGVGGGGVKRFVEIGEEFLGLFKRVGALEPTDDVLDVGCGCGRMAIVLGDYLDPTTRYEGFDVVREYVDWCADNITSQRPNFKFQHVDIFNKNYNPTGTLQGDTFRFPYDDDSFDFAFLTSVFTHMLPADVAHYLEELHRVMRPGQRVFATYFVLTPEVHQLNDSGKSQIKMLPTDDGYWTSHYEIPEAAVAYEEADLNALHKAHGFESDGFHFGSWSGRDKFLSYQDIVVLRKV
jgi:SAM-dependent methyltransferase